MRNEQEKLKSNKNVLLLRFEDLCIDYDETLKNKFLQLMKKNILVKKKLTQMIDKMFLYGLTSKNEKDVITIIEKELNEFYIRVKNINDK